MVAMRMDGLRPVVNDKQLEVLRILVDRRRSLGEDHTRMVSQVHQLLLELIPGGAKKDLSAAQAGACSPGSDPATWWGRPRRVAPNWSVTWRGSTRYKAVNKEIKRPVGRDRLHVHEPAWHRAVVRGTAVGRDRRHHPVPQPGPLRVLERHRTLPRLLRVTRPRHRLSRAGNRQINRALHMMAMVQLRNPTEGRAYYDHAKPREDLHGSDASTQAGLSDIVYPTMVDDAVTLRGEPGRATGNVSDSSAAGLAPHTGTSEKPQPGPATTSLRPALPAAS